MPTRRSAGPICWSLSAAWSGHGATKGMVVISSTFDSLARDNVKQLAQRIILIDGDRLIDLMIENGVGVRLGRRIEFKRLDEDFFAEE